MILLTRLDDSKILINELFLELVEEAPDTIVTMQNGHRYIVQEPISLILNKIQDFERIKRGERFPSDES